MEYGSAWGCDRGSWVPVARMDPCYHILAWHMASQCFHPVQYVVAVVSTTPATNKCIALPCRRSHVCSTVSGGAAVSRRINAVGTPGVACTARVLAAVRCWVCTCRTEMEVWWEVARASVPIIVSPATRSEMLIKPNLPCNRKASECASESRS